ncbi:hypothetical protein [Persicitalea sp.]|uniref:hypothetical protein n=1 Tax=Persicitalea sp. TaxID=3100273 RepID=UPI003594774E
MNYEQFDRIEAYLQDGLSSPERISFETELKTNTELRSEVELQQKLRLGLRALAIEKQILDAQKRTQTQIVSKNTTIRRLGSWQNWGLAASVTIMMGAGWLVWQYNQTSGNSSLRGLAEREMTDMRYKSMPLDSLQGITNNGNSAEARQKAEWYVALAYMHKGQKKEAKSLLTTISNKPEHSYQQRAKNLLEKGFD